MQISVTGEIHDVASRVTYGWGMIPVIAKIGTTEFATSLFRKDGGYVIPLKLKVRDSLQLDVGDMITIIMSVGS